MKDTCIRHPDRVEYARGLCSACYQFMQRRIKRGDLTEKQAVKRKEMLPRTKGWPGTNNPRRIVPFPT